VTEDRQGRRDSPSRRTCGIAQLLQPRGLIFRWTFAERTAPVPVLIRGNDRKFTASFDAVFQTQGTPHRAHADSVAGGQRNRGTVHSDRQVRMSGLVPDRNTRAS